MIAAIYARKSTEQNAVADEAKSVTRQKEHAKAYAAPKGWTVPEACIFEDDGIRGAELARRPGVQRLRAALKPRPAFQVLIVREQSRLSRDTADTPASAQGTGARRCARVCLPGRSGHFARHPSGYVVHDR